jgi:hypothetical protein
MMIAHRRVDVAELNGRGHALMRASGRLEGDELAGFAVGDRVVLRRNDRALGVANGDRGRVAAIDRSAGALTVELRDRRVTLGPSYLAAVDRHGRPAVELGYAITGHLAQGMTCRQTFVLATDQLSREWGYVALSRGTDSNRLYVIEGDAPERLEFAPGADAVRTTLAERFGRSTAQRLASDQAPAPAELVRAATELAEAERAWMAAEARRSQLERERPAWFRPAARSAHSEALAGASETADAAAERLGGVRERHAKLLAARRERHAARLAEERLVRLRRERGRDLGREFGR